MAFYIQQQFVVSARQTEPFSHLRAVWHVVAARQAKRTDGRTETRFLATSAGHAGDQSGYFFVFAGFALSYVTWTIKVIYMATLTGRPFARAAWPHSRPAAYRPHAAEAAAPAKASLQGR